MLLGDVIARFEDEGAVTETLIALQDLGLVSRISTAAAGEELTVGEFATRSVERFVANASDEDWLTLMGRMTRTDDPGHAFLSHVLSCALAGQYAGRCSAHLTVVDTSSAPSAARG